MSTFNHVDCHFCFNLANNGFLMGTVINDTWCDMNLGRFFIHGRIPSIHLGQPGNNGRTGTIAAIKQPHDLGLFILINFKVTLSAIKPHQAS